MFEPKNNPQKRVTLRELVADHQVFAPCIWDVFSARAAEQAGFEATLLSGGALSGCYHGQPDIGLMTADDLVRATQFVTAASPLPCIIDADDGYGESPLLAYRTAYRLAHAGAMSMTVDDTTGIRGYNRWGMQLRRGDPFGTIEHPCVDRKTWLAKMKACLEACEGTDCMLIARTEAALQYGLDEAIERCLLARELRAEMTLVIGLMNQEQAEYVAKYDKGWKMWPDVATFHGVPDVELKDIEPLGFNLVTTHILEGGAMSGMVNFGKHVLEDQSTIYPDTHGFALDPENFQKPGPDDIWFEREARFRDLSALDVDKKL